MMWKTFIFLAFASVVLAGKINNKRHANYRFHIKHDYDYLKHHEKVEHHEHETEEKPKEDKKVEEHHAEHRAEHHHEHHDEHHEENHEEHHKEPQKEHHKEHHTEHHNEHHKEHVKDETEQANESDVSNAEPEAEELQSDEKEESTGYEFLYKVKDPHTHDNKEQHEKKHGDEVKGMYWVLQPDGYKRTVQYHADKHSGFKAEVKYSKSEEHTHEGDHKPKSEYLIRTRHRPEKYIPVTEEQEKEPEQDKQEESAQHIPIYVI